MPEKIWSYCDGIPAEIVVPEISVIDLFRQTADKFPDRNMTEFLGKFKPYPEVEEEINRFALPPDLAIYIDVQPEVVVKRIKRKKSVMENLETQRKVKEVYMKFLTTES